MSDENARLVHASGECEIDFARRELRILGSPVPIGGRAFEIIEVLARSAGEVVSKNELMDRIWPGAIVTENTLHVHAMAVRKALGPHRNLLKTESRRGYRLLGDWTVSRHDAAQQPVGLQRMRVDGESPSTNFPVPVTRLIGRTAAVARLRDLMSAYRLLTLTGPGGIGKTSLALKAARGVVGEYTGGGWLVELASLSDPALVPAAVAGTLKVSTGLASVTPESIARSIGDRKLLLVLDNCEHLIEAVATMAEMLLAYCPHTTIIATSRETLRIQGEQVYRVLPLDVPAVAQQQVEHILSHSAVELFFARAKALDTGFSPRADELPRIGAICRHLDGIPLAIEFAAARASTFGVQQVADGLHDRFALLTTGRRTSLPRHRTLRAALDWSYDLLTEAERLLLCRLAVFPGGFTLDGAMAVMHDAGGDTQSVFEGIAELVTKSLAGWDGAEQSGRWRLLETVRVYGLQKLAERGDLDSAQRHHARYFRDLLAGTHDDRSPRSLPDLTRCIREIDNVRAALDWSFSPRGDSAVGIDLTVAYAPVWLNLSLTAEYRDRCERALREIEGSPAPDVRVRMWLQIDFGISLFDTMGGARQARDVLSRALDVAESLEDLDGQARVLSSLFTHYIFQTEHAKGLAAAERLGQVAWQMGDPAVIRLADRLTGTALVMLGRPYEGQPFLERVLQAPQPTPDQRRQLWFPQEHPAVARAFLARALWLQGFLDRAYQEAEASLRELQPSDHQLLRCRVLYFGMCRIAPSTNHFAAAEESIGHLLEAATTLNAPFWQTAARFLNAKLMVDQGQFAPGVALLNDLFETCRRTGWHMSNPEYKGALATGLAGLGALDAALDTVNEGLAGASQGVDGRDLYVADVLRVRGEILFRQKAVAAAEASFREALIIAREQKALLWEIRAALGLARMLATQSRADEARHLLGAVRDRFTEGLDAPDVRAAKAFLDELPR